MFMREKLYSRRNSADSKKAVRIFCLKKERFLAALLTNNESPICYTKGKKMGGMNVKTGKGTSELTVLPGYGRRKLLAYAESFQGLAKLFEQEENGSPFSQGNPFHRDALDVSLGEEQGEDSENSVYMTESGQAYAQEPVTEEERSLCLWHSQMTQNRALMAGHLKEMAQIMESVARQTFQTLPLSERDRRQIIRALKEQGIQVQEIYLLENGNERFQISITMKSLRTEVFTVEEIADFLSVLFDKQLLPEKNSIFFLKDQFETVIFEERARFGVLTGAARAIKENEKISGDNYSFLETENGHMVMVLSDGMGSGEKACRDSALVIELLEKYLETGFSKEMAVEMINGALLARSEEENMSTLDLCDVNLYTGNVDVFKVGSAYTYIKHEDGVEILPSATLPMGVFGQPDIERYECRLAEGECIIMLSDGVADCIRSENKEATLRDVIEMLPTKNAKELANNILQFAIHQSQGKIRDDMTVLTLSLWENQ